MLAVEAVRGKALIIFCARYNACQPAALQAECDSFGGSPGGGRQAIGATWGHRAFANMRTLIEFTAAHPWLSLGLVGSLLAALFNEVRLRALAVSALAPAMAVQAINKGAAVFDLREPKIFGEGHIPSARNIRAVDVPAAPKVKTGKAVVLVCENGLASSRLAQELRKKGSEQIFSLKGGLAAWQRDNMPVVSARGRRK